jgi:UDP-glucose:(heptosyl)LPS alpha-1,3-glucosyltransferase
MKLAFVVSLWFPFGGMQRSLLRIAQACVARGHEVHIYTGEWQGEHPQGIDVFELDTRARTNHGSNDLLAQRFAEAVEGKGYDCRIGFTKLPGLDVYYAADPCYAARVADSKPAIYRWSPRYRAFHRQEAAVFQPGAGTELMLIAHQERNKFIRYYGTEPERFHLLPPGINRQRLLLEDADRVEDRKALRREIGLQEGERMLLVVGSRFRTKGVDRVIQAFATLPARLQERSRLVVVGHGKAGPFRRQAQVLGVGERVLFTGTREDVPRFYHAADSLLHAPRSENTGTVLIEAMICGLPVLVTGNCGFAFHVEQAQAGVVLEEPFDQERLNSAVAEFLDSDRLQEWRENGPVYCDRTDLYSLIERAADVIVARAEHNRSRHAEGA